MISSRTSIKLARKWQRFATLKRKMISLTNESEEEPCSTSPITKKGHFIVYSADGRQFAVPLACLKNSFFKELLDEAMEELGRPRDDPITLPWDANFIEYALSLVQRCVGEDLQKAFLVSMAKDHCMSSFQLLHDHTIHQSSICSF